MKRIPLTQGKFALVDDCDYEYLTQWKWHYHKSKRTGYADRNGPTGRQEHTIKMHRVVAKRTGLQIVGKQVDHVDANGLNNRRRNLRVATNLQNSRHQRRPRNNTSGYKGVWWSSTCRKWQAGISVIGKRQHLGLFSDPKVAAVAYNKAARKYFGKFAFLNPI